MPDFDADRDEVLVRARAAGVTTMMTIGAGQGVEGNTRAIAIAEQHECVYATVGLHPHDAKLFSPAVLNELEALAQHPKVVAIGEIGLDYHYDFSDRTIQRKAFAAQLDLVQRLHLPVVVHHREAEGDLLKQVSDFSRAPVSKLRGLLHCFSGPVAFAQHILDLGFCLGIGGVVTFKNAQTLRDVVGEMPLDRIVLETDAPYLAPVPYRGKRNEPAYIIEVAREIARIKGITVEEVAEITSDTARKVFSV